LFLFRAVSALPACR